MTIKPQNEKLSYICFLSNNHNFPNNVNAKNLKTLKLHCKQIKIEAYEKKNCIWGLIAGSCFIVTKYKATVLIDGKHNLQP